MSIRKVILNDECTGYIDSQGPQVAKKFLYIVQIIQTKKVVSTKFVKKIVGTDFFELRITTDNEHRVITFALDNDSFIESTEIVLLNGFIKKDKKDYKPAIKRAKRLLSEYQNDEDE